MTGDEKIGLLIILLLMTLAIIDLEVFLSHGETLTLMVIGFVLFMFGGNGKRGK